MFEIIGKYQAFVFLSAEDISPNPEIISDLLNMFRDKGLLPTTFQEVGKNPLTQTIRLRLNSPNNEWGINFGINHICIEKNPIIRGGKNLGNIETFANDATEMYERILTHFKKKFNRISIKSSGLMHEIVEDKSKNIFHGLFTPIPLYQETTPFEWKSLMVSKANAGINGFDEELNVVTEINKVKLKINDSGSISSTFRIEVKIDINTSAENNESRFTADSLNSFFVNSLDIRSKVLTQIEAKING